MDEFDNRIILNDEYGREVPFEFLDLIEYEDDEFVVLLPVDTEDDEGMVTILKVESDAGDGIETYVGVEDENILTAVFEIFKNKYKDEFNFVD